MQLGTRWSVGGAAPASLPAPVLGAVAQVERELADEGVDASSWRWTLTYLEHRPVGELDAPAAAPPEHSPGPGRGRARPRPAAQVGNCRPHAP
jgi:hypothetical protein